MQKTVSKQYNVVSAMKGSMKTMLSETDLHQALGLTFQEFEARLAGTFDESSRKHLLMFSKRDELAEMQGKMDKKVGRVEWEAMNTKFAELRQYVDMMAASAIDNKKALTQEFDRKADSAMVDLALKSKADFRDLCEVRARVERLEILVTHQDAKHTTQLQELRAEMSGQVVNGEQENQDLFKAHDAQIKRLREELEVVLKRFAKYDKHLGIQAANETALAEVVATIRRSQEDIVLTSIDSLKDLQKKSLATQEQMQKALVELGSGQADNKSAAEEKRANASDKLEGLREQIEFLMQANDFSKKRQRELKRCSDSGFKETGQGLEKVMEQLSELDRSQKRQDRDIRAIDTRASQQGIVANPGELPHPCGADPGERLQNVLATLASIGGIAEDPVATPPSVDDLLSRCSPRGIDSSRNLAAAPPPSASPRGGSYGGPRAGVYAETSKSPRKKK